MLMCVVSIEESLQVESRIKILYADVSIVDCKVQLESEHSYFDLR